MQPRIQIGQRVVQLTFYLMAVVAFEMSDRHHDANLPFRRLRIGLRESRNIDGALAQHIRAPKID